MPSDWLFRALELSRARGFLGPQPIEPQIEHAEGFLEAWASTSPAPPARTLDLGSGGGIPGLYLLDVWHSPMVLLDAMEKRTAFLREVLEWEDTPGAAEVVTGRAESLAREPMLEGSFDLVVARSFGPPAVLAECASRFLTVGGLLLVSEPPDPTPDRWVPAGLGQLGLRDEGPIRTTANFRLLRQVRKTPELFPRSIGTPGKKPLF
jgi:16S rRNA (guanine527-N7)-methyltransferase